MKLKPRTVLLLAPLALSLGLWADQMIASEDPASDRQDKTRIEFVNQQEADDKEEKSTFISRVIAFM